MSGVTAGSNPELSETQHSEISRYFLVITQDHREEVAEEKITI